MSRRAYVRRATAAVATAATVGLVLAGCGGSTPLNPSSQVCVTATGHIRVDDFRCNAGVMSYDWWYLAPGQVVPRVGQRANVGSLIRPKGSVRSGLPATPTTTKTKPKATTTAQKKQGTTPKKAKPAAPKPKPAAPKVRTK